ncbi:MAG: family 78 glycoside hydrolase catalytic domain [Clostridia bacterium]|nr:family 78 glycoside hydrolase catalytic domain [Clostridia bacterium]
MTCSKKFIKATEEYNTFEKNVPEYYFRKSFNAESPCKAKITIAVCGFYELYFNGKKITKGLLSPYISNTDDYIYCDEYEITADKGENVIGVILGNGFQNNPGGYIWDFDKASFRSAPIFSVICQTLDKTEILFESDTEFKNFPSPIRSDDYRFGEYYDANYEIDGWNKKGFNDDSWNNALTAIPPKGELKICEADPIVKSDEIKPVKIIKDGESFIYDFGVSNAGICRLCIDGEKGQKIELQHADMLKDGKLYVDNVWFVRDMWERDKNIVHKDTYVCKGSKNEVYQPSFTYHGFRYVKVSGITEKQATENLLTFMVYHTDLKTMGDFHCSDETVNKLQEITRRSGLSNFYYFPTDCPQREKNGWTADAALSCEYMLLNFNPENSYREWMRNICKAQNKQGALPGIVPTGGWGFEWGNGPAWDSVLAYIPYYTYIYRGKTDMIKESAGAFSAYLKYLTTRTDDKGLIHIGLGDWCHVGNITPKAPLEVTDSVMSMDIADKMAVMFKAVGMNEEMNFAKSVSQSFKKAIRDNLIDYNTMLAKGECQTSQAMFLYYGIFNEDEREKAFEQLLNLIHSADDHIDLGVLGGRVIFHVLSDFGYSDLALKMITGPDYPSYGNWLKRGATTLWEDFLPDSVSSMNHHFWGDISGWFIKSIAGIQLNPHTDNITELDIKPSFVKMLDNASAYHIAPAGKILSSWERKGNYIILKVEIPDNMTARAILESGYCFDDNETSKLIRTGEYKIKNVLK